MVNLSSSAALSPCPLGAVYSATKVTNCVVCHDSINPCISGVYRLLYISSAV